MFGQIRIEFVFGLIIFTLVIFFIVTQINTVISTTLSDARINSLKTKANSIIEILTVDRGYPDNWASLSSQSWNKRREIEITRSSKELVNQQVRINISWDSDMKPDFSDIRFTDSDKVTNIPYWIENKSDSKWVLVWVKVPEVPAFGKKSIYMYYNNSFATNESNGNGVFIQYLDLSGTSLPSGWVKKDIGTIGNVNVSAGVLRINNSGGNVDRTEYNTTHVYKDSMVSTNFVAVAKILGQRDWDEYTKAAISVQNYVEPRYSNGMAFVTVTPHRYALFWQTDYIAPDQLVSTAYETTIYPSYIKLIKNESSVSGWNSTNGMNWTPLTYSRIPRGISRDFQYITLFMSPHDLQVGDANFSLFYVYQYTSPEPQGIIKNEENKTNYTWFPIKTIGLAEKPYYLSKDKTTAINNNCNLLSSVGLTDYRLKVYNSTNLILFCGTESLKPPTVITYRSVFVDNDLGNMTLELW